ncbi:hypothetical protein [Shewanella polaris]|uniref:Uncharacterized protein n=1 Tax=Shewanella polaris TaxID=2588449 RepID=A0A4Y5YFN6_9GAMM|nr:hypothetical protein [Shewanella polaris]QDE31601.1 hypothetical protein FH971_11855 [Shewanella polaris]
MDFMYRHFLIKYAKPEHSQKFINQGEMFLQPLSFYRKEDHNDEVGDLNEGAHKVKPFSKGILKRVLENGETEIVGTMTNGIHREFSHEYSSLAVYCIYYLIMPASDYTNELDVINEKLLKEFGGSATVIYNLEKFFDRLDIYLEENSYSYKRQSVEYIDVMKYLKKLTPFQKDKKY